MKIQLCLLLLLFFNIVPINVSIPAEILDKTDYRFNKIGIEEGLSQSTILSIQQDQRGSRLFEF